MFSITIRYSQQQSTYHYIFDSIQCVASERENKKKVLFYSIVFYHNALPTRTHYLSLHFDSIQYIASELGNKKKYQRRHLISIHSPSLSIVTKVVRGPPILKHYLSLSIGNVLGTPPPRRRRHPY